MIVEDKGNHIRVVYGVKFGDCDPAQIAYTSKIVDYAIMAIDEFWKAALDGQGWFQLNVDHDIGTAFVGLNYEFTAPITPRHPLEMEVRVTKQGRTSMAFEVTAVHNGAQAFVARLTTVFIRRSDVSKLVPPDWISNALQRFAPGPEVNAGTNR